MTVVYEKVGIYRETEENEYEELYCGSYRDVPKELMDREVVIIGVRKYSEVLLEIEVK